MVVVSTLMSPYVSRSNNETVSMVMAFGYDVLCYIGRAQAVWVDP
jgi:hypothetical protein